MAGYLGIETSDEKSYIFISYNTEDQERPCNIAQMLQERQVNIWYDNGIQKISNEEWQEQIALHIRDAEIVKERIEGGANEKAVWRLFINCPFVCINFDFFWLNKVRQLYMDF